MLILFLVYKWADSFVVTSPICEVMQSKVAVSRQTAVKDGTHHGARLPSVCIYNCLIACLLFWPMFLPRKGQGTKQRKCGGKGAKHEHIIAHVIIRDFQTLRIFRCRMKGQNKKYEGGKMALNPPIFHITCTTKRIHFYKICAIWNDSFRFHFPVQK